MYMSEEDEVKIYHIMCKISKLCRSYFYERKYLPNDGWSLDNNVEAMLSQAEKLKDTFLFLKEKYPEEEEEWDTDQMSE